MSRALTTPTLTWHCTAGFSLPPAIQRYWHEDLKWNSKGYLSITELNGTTWWLWKNSKGLDGYSKEFNPKAFEFFTNGVRGQNTKIVSCATIGGVENKGTAKHPKWVAKDTRTPEQKAEQIRINELYFDWLKKNGGNIQKAEILGHRDWSPDKNGNGIIDSWERIKECPSYDAIPEFSEQLRKAKRLSATKPKNKINYEVKKGDNLWFISRRFNVTVDAIVRQNNLKTTALKIGQKILIP